MNIEQIKSDARGFVDFIKVQQGKVKKNISNLRADFLKYKEEGKIFAEKSTLFLVKEIETESSKIEKNKVNSSLFTEILLTKNSVCQENIFSCSYLHDLKIEQSDFKVNKGNMFLLDCINICESKCEGNSFSLSVIKKFTTFQADFTNSVVLKSYFNNVKIMASRLNALNFTATNMLGCEFKQCDIQNVNLIGCRFLNCTFENVNFIGDSNCKIIGKFIKDKVIKDCASFEEFMAKLEQN